MDKHDIRWKLLIMLRIFSAVIQTIKIIETEWFADKMFDKYTAFISLSPRNNLHEKN